MVLLLNAVPLGYWTSSQAFVIPAKSVMFALMFTSSPNSGTSGRTSISSIAGSVESRTINEPLMELKLP